MNRRAESSLTERHISRRCGRICGWCLSPSGGSPKNRNATRKGERRNKNHLPFSLIIFVRRLSYWSVNLPKHDLIQTLRHNNQPDEAKSFSWPGNSLLADRCSQTTRRETRPSN